MFVALSRASFHLLSLRVQFSFVPVRMVIIIADNPYTRGEHLKLTAYVLACFVPTQSSTVVAVCDGGDQGKRVWIRSSVNPVWRQTRTVTQGCLVTVPKSKSTLESQSKITVKFPVCCRRRLMHTAILTVNLTMALKSGVAL